MILHQVGIAFCFYFGCCLLVAREASAQLYAQTLAQIYVESDFVVLAEKYESKEKNDTFRFRVSEVLKQPNDAEKSAKNSPAIAIFEDDSDIAAKLGRAGECYFVFGRADEKEITWSEAWGVKQKSISDVRDAMNVSSQGIERLRNFAPFLTSDEPLLARNAQLEFVAAKDEDFEQLDSVILDRKQIRAQITRCLNRDSPVDSRRSLNSRLHSLLERQLLFVLYAKCGSEADGDWVGRQMLQRKKTEDRGVTPEMVVCYLQLKGSQGLPMIEREFLADNSRFSDTYSVVQALRYFSVQKTSPLSETEIVKAFRKVLEKPELADLVILDLARLEDWDSVDNLVTLANADSEDNWCRLPVVNFLRICPLEKAKKELASLRELDSKVFKRANTFFTDAMIASGEWKQVNTRIRPEFPVRDGWGC